MLEEMTSVYKPMDYSEISEHSKQYSLRRKEILAKLKRKRDSESALTDNRPKFKSKIFQEMRERSIEAEKSKELEELDLKQRMKAKIRYGKLVMKTRKPKISEDKRREMELLVASHQQIHGSNLRLD